MPVVIFPLTDSDRVIAEQIKNLLSGMPKTRNKLIRYIKALDVETITRLAHHNQDFLPSPPKEIELEFFPISRHTMPTDFVNFCETEEELQPHWESVIPQQKIAGFPDFTWQVEGNPFTQLRSIICLNAAFKEGGKLNTNNELRTAYKQEAAKLGCFRAQFSEATVLIEKFCKDPSDSLRDSLVALTLQSAQLHKAPGYYLLAVIFFTIANVYQHKLLKTNEPGYKELARSHYDSAILFLSHAENTQQESKVATHNAAPDHAFFSLLKRSFPYLDCLDPKKLETQLKLEKENLLLSSHA